MRLIDADALMKEVCDLKCGCMPDKCEYDFNGDKYCEAAQYIENAPTVDPVLHAEWLYDRPGHWFCSNCHLTEGWASKWQKYCPMCGAKMDKENCDE